MNHSGPCWSPEEQEILCRTRGFTASFQIWAVNSGLIPHPAPTTRESDIARKASSGRQPALSQETIFAVFCGRHTQQDGATSSLCLAVSLLTICMSQHQLAPTELAEEPQLCSLAGASSNLFPTQLPANLLGDDLVVTLPGLRRCWLWLQREQAALTRMMLP